MFDLLGATIELRCQACGTPMTFGMVASVQDPVIPDALRVDLAPVAGRAACICLQAVAAGGPVLLGAIVLPTPASRGQAVALLGASPHVPVVTYSPPPGRFRGVVPGPPPATPYIPTSGPTRAAPAPSDAGGIDDWDLLPDA